MVVLSSNRRSGGEIWFRWTGGLVLFPSDILALFVWKIIFLAKIVLQSLVNVWHTLKNVELANDLVSWWSNQQ